MAEKIEAPSGRAQIVFGPVAIVWRDLWTDRRGLAVEWTRGRGRSLFSIGFGRRAGDSE